VVEKLIRLNVKSVIIALSAHDWRIREELCRCDYQAGEGDEKEGYKKLPWLNLKRYDRSNTRNG
jgi:hypothetical protein